METLKDYLEQVYCIKKTPTYLADRCTERKSAGHVCQVCAEVCPQNIYPTGKRKHPVWDQCLKCGLCSAACPARCITVPSRVGERFLMAVARKGKLTVACDREEGGARLSVSCVAALSWEQLAYAALREGVVISLRECAKCENESCKSIIDQNLRELKFFLGEDGYRERVTLLREGDEYRPESSADRVSRRDFFGFLGNLSVDVAYSMLPKIDDSRDHGLLFRAMLRDAVSERAKDTPSARRPTYAVRLPHFTPDCYNCGYCQTSCPNGALKLVAGKDSFTVAVDVWKCTGCGLCQKKCRAGGIDGIVPMRVSSLGTVAVAKIPNHLCAICGRPYPYGEGQEYCQVCESKLRVAQVRREREAKKKREERKAADSVSDSPVR